MADQRPPLKVKWCMVWTLMARGRRAPTVLRPRRTPCRCALNAMRSEGTGFASTPPPARRPAMASRWGLTPPAQGASPAHALPCGGVRLGVASRLALTGRATRAPDDPAGVALLVGWCLDPWRYPGRAPTPRCGSLPPSGWRLSWTSHTNQICWMHGLRKVAHIVRADRFPRRRGAGLEVAVHKRIRSPVSPGFEGSTGQLLVPHLDTRPAQEAEQVRGNFPGCPRLLPLWGQ